MTKEELDELEKLENEATPGPWVTFDSGPWGGLGAGIQAGENLYSLGEVTEEPHIVNCFLCVKLRNSAKELIAQAREAIRYREALREIALGQKKNLALLARKALRVEPKEEK